MCSKPIFCSKIALKGKTCSRLLKPQKVAPNAKSCSKVAEHNRDRPNGIRVRQVASPRFPEGQFHLEEAAGQIDKVSHEIVEEAASTLGRGRVGTIARQPAADHATCLKCNVTMVSPLPNCVKAAVVSATCVSIMSNTSLRTSIYLMCNGSKY